MSTVSQFYGTSSVSNSVNSLVTVGHVARVISTSQEEKTNRIFEEVGPIGQTIDRLNITMAHDRSCIFHPDVDSPFVDEQDVINRLLPYHIFQQPKDDLKFVISRKRKTKVMQSHWKEEVRVTKFALECMRRQEAVRDRWRKLKIRFAKRSPDDQAYYLAQVVLDADRSENAWLGNELRTARAEVEKIEREKRTTATVARMSHPVATLPNFPAQYYRGYPYPYTQIYGTSPAPTISTFPVTTTNYVPYQSNGAIPVQLPVASLPALHALGIIPVPIASLPPSGQPQPAAVLRSSTANGSILSLEINVSLLQSTQMSGLAIVLNSLVNRNNVVATASSSVTSASIP